MSSARHRREGGFTLLELVVVAAILGFLVLIAVASFYVTTGRSRRIACLRNQRVMTTAVAVYQAQKGGGTPDALENLKPYVDWPSANYGRCTSTDVPLEYDSSTGSVSCGTPGHTP